MPKTRRRARAGVTRKPAVQDGAEVSQSSLGNREWRPPAVVSGYVVLTLCGVVIAVVFYPQSNTFAQLKTDVPSQAKSNEVEQTVTFRGDNELNNGDSGRDILEEVENYKATIQKSLFPRESEVDGRRLLPVEVPHTRPNNSSVRIYVIEDFLSSYECDNLMSVHRRHVSRISTLEAIMCFNSPNTLQRYLVDAGRGNIKVTQNDFTPGTTCVNETFSRDLKHWVHNAWSYSTAFYPGESFFSRVFATRVSIATGLAERNGGKFQVTSYPVGAGFKSHTDCIEGGRDQRDRYATVVVYLSTVPSGGQTNFPELGVSITPRKGMAVVWTNMNSGGNCDSYSRHQAEPVRQGHKYILQRWYYYKSFFSLGTRVPEPALPARLPRQPRVSCDQDDRGSCRWYDEWNYNHLVDYTSAQHLLP